MREREMLEKCKCKIKKNIKENYKKMERKKIMTWMLTWLNVSAAALNATFQLLVIYRFGGWCCLCTFRTEITITYTKR